MNWLRDTRIDCYSAITELKMSLYLSLVDEAHAQQGGISGQRDVLKTTTAKRIRQRMVSDVRAGAVLPPVVIGIVMPAAKIESLVKNQKLDLSVFLKGLKNESLSIIDGMQRTEAFLEASEIDKGVLDSSVRVDFWLAKSVRALVYRMLVLNTGQVPWNLARQLSVVYAPLLVEIKANVQGIDRIITPDKPGRRVSGGQFSSEALIELFMAFSLRKQNVDTRENLSEEFSRLDLVENVADEKVQGYFYETLSTMAELDIAFDKLEAKSEGRFSRGRDIFSSQPARVGYIVAASQAILGKVGLEKPAKERNKRMQLLVNNATALTSKIGKMKQQQLKDFLKLDVLSETLDRRVGQVGRYERTVFYEAFKLLIEENFEVPSMEPCWRAN